MMDAFIPRRKKSPFPMRLIPISDASLWTLNDLGNGYGALVTADKWLHLKGTSTTAAATLKKAINFSTAKKITFSYSQNYSILPRISLVNVSTGKTDYTFTATATGTLNNTHTAEMDVSAAKGKYYLSIDTVNPYGDRTCYVKTLEITR